MKRPFAARRALREGGGPDGKHYYPSFPHTSYTRLNDADIHAPWINMRTVPTLQ